MTQDLKADLSQLAVRLAQDVRGATAIEYALIASVVFLAIFGSVQAVGQTALLEMFERTANAFAGATSAPSPPGP